MAGRIRKRGSGSVIRNIGAQQWGGRVRVSWSGGMGGWRGEAAYPCWKKRLVVINNIYGLNTRMYRMYVRTGPARTDVVARSGRKVVDEDATECSGKMPKTMTTTTIHSGRGQVVESCPRQDSRVRTKATATTTVGRRSLGLCLTSVKGRWPVLLTVARL